MKLYDDDDDDNNNLENYSLSVQRRFACPDDPGSMLAGA
jgi:hypothetical protein